MNITPQSINYHSVGTMFRISGWFLVALLCSVRCIQRQILYSRLDKQMSNSSLTVFLGDVANLIPCAELCFRDDYCAEFVYNETSGQCVGLHCVNKGNYSYQYVVPASPRMLYFGKGNLSFMIFFFIISMLPWNISLTLISNNLL